MREAHKLGITSKLQPVCSIALGTQAVNPLEMTSAYATLAARGVHRDPQAFESVRGTTGALIGKLNAPGAQTIPQNTADLVTYALEGVVSHGTGTAAYFGRPAAGKTGTAEDFKDAWFCGYVPQLAACVWIGYPKAEISLYGVEGVARRVRRLAPGADLEPLHVGGGEEAAGEGLRLPAVHGAHRDVAVLVHPRRADEHDDGDADDAAGPGAEAALAGTDARRRRRSRRPRPSPHRHRRHRRRRSAATGSSRRSRLRERAGPEPVGDDGHALALLA